MMAWLLRKLRLIDGADADTEERSEQPTLDFLRQQRTAAEREAARIRTVRERLTTDAFPFTGERHREQPHG